ncbi:MAG: hypothetical protein ACM3RX_05965 [Methanococcaceae archaeon]
MKITKTIFLVSIITTVGFSQVIKSEKVAEAKFNSSLFNFTNSKIPSNALPLSFLPDDIAIDTEHNIYVAEPTTLRIIKIEGEGHLINQIIINDVSLVNSPEKKEYIQRSNKRPFNLKLAVDSKNNLYVMLLWTEQIVNIYRYTEDLKLDKTFIFQKPYPEHYIRDFLISPDNQLLIRTFPVAPVGYEQYSKEGLVFEYSTEGKLIGRKRVENSIFDTILKSKKALLNNTSINDVFIYDTFSFLKINPKGEKFIYGIKSYSSEKVERNKKYNLKDLGLVIINIKEF